MAIILEGYDYRYGNMIYRCGNNKVCVRFLITKLCSGTLFIDCTVDEKATPYDVITAVCSCFDKDSNCKDLTAIVVCVNGVNLQITPNNAGMPEQIYEQWKKEVVFPTFT